MCIRDRGKVALSHDTVYSTPEIIRAERSVIDRHTAGLHQSNIRLATPVVEAAIDRLEAALGSELGPDQAAAVRAITQDGHQFQAVQGLAGAGKTTAMTAAVDAWHTAGIKVQALDVLDGDGRIKTADTWPELLDRLADDWLTHHTSAVDAGRAPSQKIAERNRDREALNTRAQTLLTEAGRLGRGFQIEAADSHRPMRSPPTKQKAKPMTRRLVSPRPAQSTKKACM